MADCRALFTEAILNYPQDCIYVVLGPVEGHSV